MIIDVKGHSGCDIEVIKEDDKLYVYKSSYDPGYFSRLEQQALKQHEASKQTLQHIRVPKILDIVKAKEKVTIKMDYVYSRNFIEFFEQSGFEQIDYLIESLISFIETEIKSSPLSTISRDVLRNKLADVKTKIESNPILKDDSCVEQILNCSLNIFNEMEDMELPVGMCHGDLTFSNILFNGNNYYLIDFLDSFIESPIIDIVKLRQDTSWLWSQLMYMKPLDSIRLKIIMSKIDTELDMFFCKYNWYRELYNPLQLMNFLRILQYAHEPRVISYLKTVINEQIKKF